MAREGTSPEPAADNFDFEADFLLDRDDEELQLPFVCRCRAGFYGNRCELRDLLSTRSTTTLESATTFGGDELSGSGGDDGDDGEDGEEDDESTTFTPLSSSTTTTIDVMTTTTTTTTTVYAINCILQLFEGPLKNTRFTRSRLLDRRERVASATTCGEICKGSQKFGCTAFVYGSEQQLCRLYTQARRDDMRTTAGFEAYFMSPRCFVATKVTPASTSSATRPSTSTRTTAAITTTATTDK